MAKEAKVQEEKKEPILKAGVEQNVNEEPQTAESVVEAEPEQEEAAVALQQQLDEAKRAGEIQRQRAEQLAREREEAIRQAQQNAAEVAKFQKEAQESQYDVITSGLAAANAAAEKAQLDIENAAVNSDYRALAEAQRRLAKAEANIAQLENGKMEVEARRKAEQERPPQQQQTQQQTNPRLPETAVRWLNDHPDYLRDPRKNAKIQSLHWDVIDKGHEPFSTAYFIELENMLGMNQTQQQEQPTPQPQQRTSILSAPVSREAPSSVTGRPSGRTTLTREEREAAKMANISEVEYLKQKQRLSEMRANGSYGER